MDRNESISLYSSFPWIQDDIKRLISFNYSTVQRNLKKKKCIMYKTKELQLSFAKRSCDVRCTENQPLR